MYVHKIGSSLSLSGQVTPKGSATLPNFETWVGKAQLRDLEGLLISTLDFEWLDTATGLIRISKADTVSWQQGLAELDIRFTVGETTVYTTTQQITLERRVTSG
jgi:hypothetical protein